MFPSNCRRQLEFLETRKHCVYGAIDAKSLYHDMTHVECVDLFITRGTKSSCSHSREKSQEWKKSLVIKINLVEDCVYTSVSCELTWCILRRRQIAFRLMMEATWLVFSELCYWRSSHPIGRDGDRARWFGSGAHWSSAWKEGPGRIPQPKCVGSSHSSPPFKESFHHVVHKVRAPRNKTSLPSSSHGHIR